MGRSTHLHWRSCAFAVVLSWNRKRIAQDRLNDKAVRSRREAVAGAKLNVDRSHFEIRDCKQLVALLLQRQKITDLAVVCVVFEADEPVVAKIAGEPHRRCEICFARGAEAYIYDWVDDELPFFVSDPDDGPNLQPPLRR